MHALAKRFVFWSVLAALLALGLAWSFRPQPVPVDLVTLAPAPLEVTVEEEGETRVHDIYTVSAPVAGRLRRVTLHAGDPVVDGQTVLARIEPRDAVLLDPRTEQQAEAELKAAAAAETVAAAELEEARAQLAFAEAEHERAIRLAREGTISQRDRDEAERALRASRARVATAYAALDVRRFELQRAHATLAPPADGIAAPDCACVTLRAPASGQVLRVVRRSEGAIQAGEPILELGDPRDLEIVVDLLSADAVQVEPGQRVVLERWGGDAPLSGRVRRVEPFGFTKVSALGIEEQRVNVLIDLVSPPEAWSRLAHGYQLDARIVLWEAEEALAVPLLALFRDEDRWAVFVAEGGRAQLRHVLLGRRSSLRAEVVEGLEAGERVVLHPSDRVVPGARVAARG